MTTDKATKYLAGEVPVDRQVRPCCPECEGPLQWRCPACRIAQSEAVADMALCAVCGRPPHACDDHLCVPATAPVAAQRDFLLTEVKRLRAALAELLACHTESAGWTMSMISNRAEFDAMLARSQERLETAVGAARAALGA